MTAKLLTIEPNPPVSEDVIDILREACAWVEKDQVSSIAIAVIHRDGSASTSWSGSATAPTLIGAVERLKYNLLRSMG